ncbi:ABC transporter ATP-binding protein [Celeribacter halophilus]|jgi:ABC-type branched-subunit amino acid transport system ATPase component|uniref:ABC transporter ATP-binding protein n=1 Tax=Celeribacter halophilus TaxID=576117 RepID=UPI002FD69648
MSEVLLEFKNLGKNFGGVRALDGFDMQVKRGEIIGLIGPNGSGKTTSFNLMTGIYAPSQGEVHFDGADITGMSARKVYEAGIARTFQRSRLCLPLSIFDNIMIGNHARLNTGLWFNLFQRRALRGQIEEFYTQARDLVAGFSEDLAGRMFDPVGSLPMIERRRIEICRALISKPKLLLLDEPSAGMTHDETAQMMDDILAVRDRMGGLSIIIIEHEMGVIERLCDQCVVLSYGRKISEGSYAHIAADPEVQSAYLGMD